MGERSSRLGCSSFFSFTVHQLKRTIGFENFEKMHHAQCEQKRDGEESETDLGRQGRLSLSFPLLFFAFDHSDGPSHSAVTAQCPKRGSGGGAITKPHVSNAVIRRPSLAFAITRAPFWLLQFAEADSCAGRLSFAECRCALSQASVCCFQFSNRQKANETFASTFMIGFTATNGSLYSH
jgi:hypothetical protein